ncbi:hypothetical protein [Marinobacter alexandrii]|uniref:hypothetical protein n=1 Tax=Marinobacter alexandrii TaxID=2570351 RepID=UPI001107DBD3|nr:hypothetical protein [Marinobacter alexandrii]
MSDTKFTPGPWSVHNTGDVFTPLGAVNASGLDAPSDDGWHIADCDMGGLFLEEVRANAHLIAAAPRLYKALENAARVLSYVAEEYPGHAKDLREANAALAEARGES